jgi:hypothetical protein
VDARAHLCSVAMFSKKPLLGDRHLLVDFGDCFAYNAAMPSRANQVRETNMAKKTLKKSKKIEATKPLTRTIKMG